MQLLTNAPSDGTLWSHYEGDENSLFIWRYYATEADYLAFLRTLALTSNTHVTIDGSSEVYGSVYGGGERGITLGGVDVNMTSGTVHQDIYGGGSLADSNTSMWDAAQNELVDFVALPSLIPGTSATGYYSSQSADALITATDAKVQSGTTYYANYKTNVNLTGGTVEGDVYGGGLGRLEAGTAGQAGYVSPIEAMVYGDVLVTLNGTRMHNTKGEDDQNNDITATGRIFGCNNLNGSPKGGVTVHAYKTVPWIGTDHEKGTYDVAAIYGGGNLAMYEPASNAKAPRTDVIIDGCELTSIEQVYGGGNAASVSETNVTVNGTFEIQDVFGGGNGKDRIQKNGVWMANPGANVGYKDYSAYETSTDATHGASTKELREQNYSYGSGKTQVSIYGGTVHAVYGGSNTKGNVRVASVALLDGETFQTCEFDVDDAYGGGKNADMDGTATLIMKCIQGMKQVFGGAEDADVLDDVNLNITNGTFEQVFGGNNKGGRVAGSITVNIEETGCKPIIIGELYGGGNEASYSIYGYKQVTENGKTVWKPRTSANDAGTGPATPYASPVINVKSFTGIGNIFGGGYGAGAVMVGDPTVNINVVKGRFSNQTSQSRFTDKGYTLEVDPNNDLKRRYKKTIGGNTVYVPFHGVDSIGAIYNVFGGGNKAKVIGTPHVNIGTLTGEPIALVNKSIEDSEGRLPSDANWVPSYQLATVEGVDIRGNVFGGGNNADVDGDAEVVIGKNNTVKTYMFTSSNEDGSTTYSTGLAQTTGATETISNKEYAEVVILTNGKYGEYVGNKFYVDPKGTGRLQLYDTDKQATSLWVDIKPFEQKKTYSFTSYGAENGGSPYSTGGTATATGNFKTFSDQEYMQIVVLTNPGYDEWVGKTFYVTTAEQTSDNPRRQLYKATGEPVGVWVTIDNE